MFQTTLAESKSHHSWSLFMTELVLDPETSARLSKIPQKNTKPEKQVCSIVRALGHSYRKNAKRLPGSPDLSNVSKGWALFVHGCYWHHHEGCSKATVPKRNTEFWVEKFHKNRARDARKIEELEATGLRVKVVWECELGDMEKVASELAEFLSRREASL
jgi:DNA mismatch endonuclease Vsr